MLGSQVFCVLVCGALQVLQVSLLTIPSSLHHRTSRIFSVWNRRKPRIWRKFHIYDGRNIKKWNLQELSLCKLVWPRFCNSMGVGGLSWKGLQEISHAFKRLWVNVSKYLTILGTTHYSYLIKNHKKNCGGHRLWTRKRQRQPMG